VRGVLITGRGSGADRRDLLRALHTQVRVAVEDRSLSVHPRRNNTNTVIREVSLLHEHSKPLDTPASKQESPRMCGGFA